MKTIFKKTSDLSFIEIAQICNIFSIVFLGRKKSVKEFNDEFCNSALGFSYHALLLDEDHIVGAQSYIPFYYYFDDEKLLFALSVDTMILQQYRNFDNFYNLWSSGRKYIKNEGVVFYFGFPNENSFQLSLKAFGDKHIGDLTTYILPLKIGSLKHHFRYLGFLFFLVSHIMLFLSHLNLQKNVSEYRTRKDRASFNCNRYKWFNCDYNIINQKNFSFVYKISDYNGIKAAFLMDIYPNSQKNFDKAVRIMHNMSHKYIKIALYVGNLDFCPISMIKVPKKFEPKKFHFVGKILDESKIDSHVVYELKDWEVNLSSCDLL